MNHCRTYTIFTSIIGKSFFFLALMGLLVSCEKNDYTGSNGLLASGYSVLVNNGNVLVSGFKSENDRVSTKYWINGETADQSRFTELLKNKSTYRQAVNGKFRLVYGYKDAQAYGIFLDGDDIYVSGATGNVPADYRPCYWKNGVMVDLPM